MDAGEAQMEDKVSTNNTNNSMQIYNRERRNCAEKCSRTFVDAQTEDKTRLVSNGVSCSRDDTRQEYRERKGQLWRKDSTYLHQLGDKGVSDNGMISY